MQQPAGPWGNIQTVVWLVGLAILAWHGWWWPGILVLVAVSMVTARGWSRRWRRPSRRQRIPPYPSHRPRRRRRLRPTARICCRIPACAAAVRSMAGRSGDRHPVRRLFVLRRAVAAP